MVNTKNKTQHEHSQCPTFSLFCSCGCAAFSCMLLQPRICVDQERASAPCPHGWCETQRLSQTKLRPIIVINPVHPFSAIPTTASVPRLASPARPVTVPDLCVDLSSPVLSAPTATASQGNLHTKNMSDLIDFCTGKPCAQDVVLVFVDIMLV